MLGQICEKVGIPPTSTNKEVVKAMLKKAAKIETLGRMQTDDEFTHNIRLSRFITNSAMLLSSEFGIEIDLPWETGVEEQDMQNFLKSIYHEYRKDQETA